MQLHPVDQPRTPRKWPQGTVIEGPFRPRRRARTAILPPLAPPEDRGARVVGLAIAIGIPAAIVAIAAMEVWIAARGWSIAPPWGSM